jgi:cellulose synthase/poly-beta-1,6-N-acetylglucosamine synthase-like glycosyltransferase
MTPELSVIVPTHNPDPERLQRTLAGLRGQTLPVDRWEAILVDNASTLPVEPMVENHGPSNLRVLREPELGLTSARRSGLKAARGNIVVFADDDNVLASDYLQQSLETFARLPSVGAIGGKSVPAFAVEPADWQHAFFSLLALRDLGSSELVSDFSPHDPAKKKYPSFAPIGAGMALRRAAVEKWLQTEVHPISDRRGGALTSAGDNDIILRILKSGWQVAYVPQLKLTHLIPASRLDPEYLGRLNHGIQKSWMQVLTLHEINPWPTLPSWTVPLRRLKAWFTYHAWSSADARIRWLGACGHFEGRVPLKTPLNS